MFSYNSKHGWHDLRSTGLALTREQRKAYDDSVRYSDDKGREQASRPRRSGRRRSTSPARTAAARATPLPRGVTFDGTRSPDPQWSVGDARKGSVAVTHRS
jgi:excinuclease ABC subunit A